MIKITKKPKDTLTWNKNDENVKIDRYIHQTIYINRRTGQKTSMTEVSEVPPITRKRKHK